MLECRIQDSISSLLTGVSSPVIIQKARAKLNNLTQAMDYLRKENLNKKVNLGLNAVEKQETQPSSLTCPAGSYAIKLN